MRLGIDCRIYGKQFTGIGRYTYELVSHFIGLNKKLKKPHEIVLFFNNPQYREFIIPKNSNIKKILVKARHYSLAEQTSFLHALNKQKLDLAFFPHFNVPILYRKPFIVTIHDLTLTFYPGKKMTRFYQRWAYHLAINHAVNKARKIIAVSKNTKKDIVEQLKIPKNRINVIYNGISNNFSLLTNPEVAQKTLKKYKLERQFLLYTGVWRSHKNLPNLIRAFDILIKKHKIDIQLAITGKKDPFYPEIETTIRAHQLEDRTVLTGIVEENELNHLYNAALLYVFPSLYEGFGMPPLEAMKCGTPVVASNSSSIPEVCGQENALFFDPEDPEDIAEKIIRLYKDADLQAKFVEKGVVHSAKFSWKSAAEKTFELLNQSLQNSDV